LTLSKI